MLTRTFGDSFVLLANARQAQVLAFDSFLATFWCIRQHIGRGRQPRTPREFTGRQVARHSGIFPDECSTTIKGSNSAQKLYEKECRRGSGGRGCLNFRSGSRSGRGDAAERPLLLSPEDSYVLAIQGSYPGIVSRNRIQGSYPGVVSRNRIQKSYPGFASRNRIQDSDSRFVFRIRIQECSGVVSGIRDSYSGFGLRIRIQESCPGFVLRSIQRS